MSTAIETIAAMTPEERSGARKILAVVGALIDNGAPAPKTKRPRARPRPRVELPANVTDAELERHRAELTARGMR